MQSCSFMFCIVLLTHPLADNLLLWFYFFSDEDSELLDLISEVDFLISKVVSLITDVVEEVDILLHSKVSPPTLCAFFCIQQTPPYLMHDASIATLDCWGPPMSMMLFIARRLSSISCEDSPSVDFCAINIS